MTEMSLRVVKLSVLVAMEDEGRPLDLAELRKYLSTALRVGINREEDGDDFSFVGAEVLVSDLKELSSDEVDSLFDKESISGE